MKRLIPLLLLGLCGPVPWGAAQAAPAEGPMAPMAPMTDDQVRDLLQTTGLPGDDEMRKQFYRAKVTPYEDPGLYLEVNVPKGWVSRPVFADPQQRAGDREHPVPLLEMGPKHHPDVTLQALYMRVNPDVGLDKFLMTYARAAGFQVVGRQRGNFNNRAYEEALLTMDPKDLGPHMTRLTVSRRGDKVFMIACSAKSRDFPRWKRDFATAVVTFDPSGKPGN